MAFTPFRKTRIVSDSDVTERNINTFQDNVAAAFAQLLGKDALDSTIVKDVKLTAGLNRVPHLLGRPLAGYIVIRSHGGFPWIYDQQDTNTSPQLLLDLVSATDVTVDLLCF